METRKLRHAVALARFLSFTRAAEDLNITQSALSRSIQALEIECRLQIFDRTRGGVSLTQLGREFIRHAEQLLRNEAALRNVIDQSSSGEGGHIALGVTPLIARILLAPIMAQRISQPHFHAEVAIGSSRELLAKVMQETLDLCVCVADPAVGNSALSSVTLAELPLAAIVRQGHPLADADGLHPEDMERYPLVRSPPYSFDDYSFPVTIGLVRPRITVADYDVLDRIVSTSDAIWVTCPLAAQDGIANGRLIQLPISWLPQTTITLVAYALNQRTLSPLARSVLQQFQSVAGAISQPQTAATPR